MKGWKVFFFMLIILGLLICIVGFIGRGNKSVAVIASLISIIAYIWLLLSWPAVKPKEVAVKVMFNEPVSVKQSGYVFVPKLPGCFLDRFPTDLFDLDYPKFKVQTMEGLSKDKKECGSFEVEIDVIGYAKLPRDEDLITVQKANLPKDKEGLTDRTKEWVQTKMRLLASSRTWRDLVFNMVELDKDAQVSFQAEGPLFQAGFKKEDLSLGLQEIILPVPLVKVLSEAETAEIEAKNQAFRSMKAFLEKFGSVLISRGINLASLVDELKGLEPENREAFVKFVQELSLNTDLASKGGYLKIEGVEGNPLAGLIAMWKKIGPAIGHHSEDAESNQLNTADESVATKKVAGPPKPEDVISDASQWDQDDKK